MLWLALAFLCSRIIATFCNCNQPLLPCKGGMMHALKTEIFMNNDMILANRSHLKDLLADEARCSSLSHSWQGLLLDLSRQQVTSKTMQVSQLRPRVQAHQQDLHHSECITCTFHSSCGSRQLVHLATWVYGPLVSMQALAKHETSHVLHVSWQHGAWRATCPFA